MRRRPDDQHGGIELLDVVAEPTGAVDEAVSSSGSSRWLPLALVGVVGLGLAGVATSGGDPSAAPTSEPTPSVTVSVPEPEPSTTARRGPLYGDGPDLDWMPVPVDVGTAAFTWSESAFVALDGDTAWRIELGTEGRPISANPTSPLVDHPDYIARRSGSAWILTPSDPFVDHLLVVRDAQGDAVRVELPPPTEENASEFVRPSRWIEAAVVGERVVVSLIDGNRVNLDAIAQRAPIDLPTSPFAFVDYETLWIEDDRSGQPMPFLLTDLGLDANEIQALRLAANDQETRVFSIDLVSGAADPALDDTEFFVPELAVNDGVLSLSWQGTTGGRRATTADGVVWEETLVDPGNSTYMIEFGSVMYRPLESLGGSARVERSIDDGATWQRSPSPISEAPSAYTPESVFIGSPWVEFDRQGASYEIPSDNPDVIVTLSPNEGWVTVAAASDPEVLLFDGTTWGDRIQWTPTLGVVILDADGTTLTRLRQEDIDTATHRDRADHDIAFGSWPLDADEAEWRVVSLRETFGVDARRVAFVAGSDAILAVVTTTSGYELYISPLTAS